MNLVIEKIRAHEGLSVEWTKFVEQNLYSNTFSIIEDFVMNNNILPITWEFLHKHGTKEGRNEMMLYAVDLIIEKYDESHSN
jgi:hypothetical protein